MDDYKNLLGLTAGALTTCSFIPQVYQIWKTRSAEDISYKMYFAFSLGSMLWLLYGIAVDSVPVAIANALTLSLNFTVIALKWNFENRREGKKSKAS